MGNVRVTYEIWTEEDAEIGDTDNKGWVDEEGTDYTPEEAFKLVSGCEPSNSPKWQPGTWYTDYEYHENFRTGEKEQRSYFLSSDSSNGFTPEEQQLIYDSVQEGHWLGDATEASIRTLLARAKAVLAWQEDEDVADKEAVAPPGFEKVVKKLKKNKEVDNPWALAWSMKNKGDKPHRAVAQKLLAAARTLLAADD